MKKVVCLLALMMTIIVTSHARQVGDSTLRKNTIKLDITSYWLYRNAVVLAYERVNKNKPYQSWGITAGYQQLTPLGTLDDVNVTRETSAAGLKLGGEYRFYLQKENKYKAPRGVYLGPYATLHNYSNARAIEVVNDDGVPENADLKTDLNILNIGIQLGYQFVLNNRWAIDIVFIGPSVSRYAFKASLDGNITVDPDDITNEVVLALIDKFPAFEDLINEGETNSKGRVSTWSYGYRFQLQFGYHFGRKKR